MKKKTRKQGKRRRSARHAVRSVHAKRRKTPDSQTVEPPAIPWLRMAPSGIEEELDTADLRDDLARRNGRRQLRDVDLYIPETKSRTR